MAAKVDKDNRAVTHMSYYIGFRFGWLRLGRHMLLWNDRQQYPYVRDGWTIRGWNVRFK